MKRTKKLYGIVLSVCMVIVAIAVIMGVYWRSNNRESLYSDNNYSGNYYSVELPQGWSIEGEGIEVNVFFSEERIATIVVEERFKYGQTTESMVANWIGMKAFIISENPVETLNKEVVFNKTIIGFEQSAAAEINGESPWPDETHYFYISEDKLFIDIFLQNEEYAEDVENIVKSFRILK